MRIVVCIKQVPLVWAMKFDPATRTLKREGVPNEVSAFDLRALARAIALRQQLGGEVAVLTMGPPQARKALEECLAIGADRGVHLCDVAMAGSDTLATARALAAAIRREPFDLVLCGRHSVDAETGQVGPEVAEILGIPQVTAARTVEIDLSARCLRAERETDIGHELVECYLPALVSAGEDLAPEPEATPEGREAAKNKPIATLSAADLGLEASEIGQQGSPTWVAGLEVISSKRLGRVVAGDRLAGAIDELVGILLGQGLFGEWKVEPGVSAEVRETAPVARDGARDVWVYVERLGGALRPVTAELLTKACHLAARLRSRVTAIAMGSGAEGLADALARYGAEHLLLADDVRLEHYDTDLYASVLGEAIRTRAPGIVLLPSTAQGRDLAPRVAARLGLGLTGDCLDLELDEAGRLRQMKPAFGGSIVAPVLSKTLPEMATVRAGMLRAEEISAPAELIVERLALAAGESRMRVLSRVATAEAATALDEAEVVVGIGMGLGGPGNLALVQPLIAVLGAALCATRDVTDAHWLPRQYQVGFTGRSIAPKVYVAIGVRGAVYHMAGMRRAGIIVAINKDPKAPIFKAADYGIVGDCEEVVPLLTRRLAEAREGHA